VARSRTRTILREASTSTLKVAMMLASTSTAGSSRLIGRRWRQAGHVMLICIIASRFL